MYKFRSTTPTVQTISNKGKRDGVDLDGKFFCWMIIKNQIMINQSLFSDPNAPKKKRGAIEYDPEGDSCTRILHEWRKKKELEKRFD